VCDVGYYLDYYGSCIACPEGFEKLSTGNQECMKVGTPTETPKISPAYNGKNDGNNNDADGKNPNPGIYVAVGVASAITAILGAAFAYRRVRLNALSQQTVMTASNGQLLAGNPLYVSNQSMIENPIYDPKSVGMSMSNDSLA
jgi:hypothetical protein